MEIPGLAEKLQGSASQDTGFKVWRRNWDILLAFLSVSTQWRAIATASGAVYWMGLDYSAARADLELAGTRVTPRLWNGIKVMECAARDALNGVRG